MYAEVHVRQFIELLDKYLDGPQSILVVFLTATYNRIRCSSFDNIQVLMFFLLGLQIPIHAPKCWLWGYYPENGEWGQ